MPVSKPFVIATSGPTVDGRTITPEWISQMAASYDPKVYTAVANLEHYLSSVPDSVFGAYGKVVSLSTQEATIMGEKKLQLLAVVDANAELVAMQQKGKKAFSSMEVLNNFIGKGVAYLSGLAFTDTPASIGTEAMKFSLGGAPGERFAFAGEVALEFETEADKPTAGETLFNKVKDLLGLGKKEADERFADQSNAIEIIANSQKEALDKFTHIVKTMQEQGLSIKLYAEAANASRKEFTDLVEKLGMTGDGTKQRPPAAGGDGKIATDC
ncbi:MAG: GPO family capsid scaffolding protein [Azonexus sp.]|nr:GPO family capsid scaffolding protein [Azonexus sp.]MDZ4313611.1 GPO family capsid scaffolding protein [Azonexus sp.]